MEYKIRQAKIMLVGNPNVGKSVIFHKLTGNYVTVSNYPGTTVETTTAKGKIGKFNYELVDTPGLYSLESITEEEKVTRKLLFSGDIDFVIQVLDAKNIKRMLPLTLQIMEAGIPVILVINMMDEAKKMGIDIDVKKLAHKLGIPVIAAVATKGQGLEEIKKTIANYLASNTTRSKSYSQRVNKDWFQSTSKNFDRASKVLKGVVTKKSKVSKPFLSQFLDKLTLSPITGFLIFLVVLYLGLYKFVGQFGGGYLVDFLENRIFKNIIIPQTIQLAEAYIISESVRDLLAGEYGILTMGLRYALAVILPIVGTFFFFFSFLEDSGYLPRLSLMADRACKKIGLNGRAIIPLTLGLGCGTMAVIVARTLESKRERIITTLLLAIAIPCSAQLGLIMALLAESPVHLSIWLIVVLVTLMIVGRIAKVLVPGDEPYFYMEIPPLRIPSLSNIIIKSYSRMNWYLKEVLPVFIFISIFLWFGQVTGLINSLENFLAFFLLKLDLPAESAMVFILGFIRRDYGAAGLYDLYHGGIIQSNQLLIAAVVLTLSVPCLAQLAVMLKERGALTAFFIAILSILISFSAGYFVSILI